MSWIDLAGWVNPQPTVPGRKRRATLAVVPSAADLKHITVSWIVGPGETDTDNNRNAKKEDVTADFDDVKESKPKFDDVLVQVGDFGLYQKRLLFVMCLTACCVSFQNNSPIFSMKIPDHRCKLPDFPNDTYEIQSPYHESLVNRTIPGKNGKYSDCFLYDDMTSKVSLGRNRTQTECTEWVYDRSVFTATIVTHLDLVCDKTIFRSHSNMMIIAGKFCGALITTATGDYFGRQRLYTVMVIGMAISAVGMVFVQNIPMLMVLRFLEGASVCGANLSCQVISSELLGTSKRRYTSLVFKVSSVVVKLTITLLAFLLRHWQYFQAALAVPVGFVLIGYFFIPESPRWLVSKGKFKKAQRVLDRVAKTNGKVPTARFEEEAIHTIQDLVVKQKKKAAVSPLSLFRVPELLKRYMLLYLAWILTAMCTFGLTLNVSNMSGDIFVNFLLLIVADVVSLFLYTLLVERVGRKLLIIAVSMVGGLCCIAIIFPVVLGGSDWILQTLTMGGRVYAATATSVLYIFSFELFPTVLASFGFGSCNMLSRLSSIASPYVADLSLFVEGVWGPAVPYVVFGTCGVVTAICIFLMPETRGRLLPETVKDAEHFGKKENYNTQEVDVAPPAPSTTKF